MLSFSSEATYRPVAYELVRYYDIRINILKAEIEIGRGGKLLMELASEQDNIDKAIAYLKGNGIGVSSLASKVFYDKSRCTDCGSCVSACPAGALTIGAPNWKLDLNTDKCIICKLCLTSCPMKLFSIEFAE